jgi:transposase-like protein
VLPLDRPLLDEITLGASVAALVALISGAVANLRVRKLRRGMRMLDGPNGPEGVLDALNRGTAETQALRSELARAKGELDIARSELADALRHVAVVRYDAFGDMGGRMSFTAALLDDSGDGLVITSINGRTEARAYAKGVKQGTSDQSLSPEESEAIALALGRKVKA